MCPLSKNADFNKKMYTETFIISKQRVLGKQKQLGRPTSLDWQVRALNQGRRMQPKGKEGF